MTPTDPLPPTGTFWKVPSPYGYASALDAAGTVAAPLLAGFSIALVGLLIGLPTPGPVPLRDPALTLLVVATLFLLACVQCSVWAREYTTTPSDITQWWPELRDPGQAASERADEIRREQWAYAALKRPWVSRARRSYDVGILFLLSGLATLLVPANLTVWRVVAVAVTGVGICGELYWTIAPTRRGWPLVRRVFPRLSDAAALDSAAPAPYSGPGP